MSGQVLSLGLDYLAGVFVKMNIFCRCCHFFNGFHSLSLQSNAQLNRHHVDVPEAFHGGG